MLIVDRPQTDPYFNLAAEEYLLRNLEEDCFMLWVNEPSVVIGKHQNAFAEIDATFIEQENIPVIRRISGGGTVFHDPGNLNFSFIRHGDREGLVDFRRFTQPIIDFLNSLGIAAHFAGKNDIRVGDLKVSGNAEHVFRNKVLHHGTLLFDSKLGSLNSAIRGKEKLYQDKAVKSVRSTVANISGFLESAKSMESFKSELLMFVEGKLHPCKRRSLDSFEINAIEELVSTRYKTWDWNFGYSPNFVFSKSITLLGQSSDVNLEVRQGKIHSFEVAQNQKLSEAGKHLLGTKFRSHDVFTSLVHAIPSDSIPVLEIKMLVQSIFQ